MSKLRYEQTQDTSHISHSHDGLSGVRLQYDVDLHSQPRTLNNARQAKVRLTGQQGTIDYLEHGCGLTPIVKCYVGGKEVKIQINIDRTTGFVTWSSEHEFTRGDEAYLILYGLATEYVIDDDAPEIDLTEYWCGYEWNVNDSDPSVTRITGKGLEDYFLRDGGGILKGKLFKYVAVNPSTKEEVEVPIDDAEAYEEYRYGQHGDLFAKMRGQLYYKVEKEGDIRRKKLSRYPLPGFKPYHSNDYIVYIGLYEASCNNERTKIYSRVTPQSEYTTHVGGNKDTNYTEKLYNMPATYLNTPTFSNIAHSKGEGYDIMDYMTWLMLSDLFMAEFGTRNVQLAIQSNDSNGYSQGGLGNGCTNVSNWEAYNILNPPAQIGCTDTHGSGCGQSLIPACIDMGLTPSNAIYANRFYGIENPFGHIFKQLTGIHFITKGNTTDSFESYKTFICDDPSKFMIASNRDNGTDDNNIQLEAGYDYEGEKCHDNGYIKDVIFGDYGSMIPSAIGGGTSTYLSDYNYSNFSGGGGYFSGLRWSTFGGYANSGYIAGLFCVETAVSWSYSARNYGSRLCLYKQPYEETPFFVEDCSGEDNEVVIVKKLFLEADNNIAEDAPTCYFEYSYDKINWVSLNGTSSQEIKLYLPHYGRMYIRGKNPFLSIANAGNNITCNKDYNIGGNILSLLLKDDYSKTNEINKGTFRFSWVFSEYRKNSAHLISAEKLILVEPEIFGPYCYFKLFTNCSKLITPPNLPFTQLTYGCYQYMFQGTHLTEAHQLPATNLQPYCYTQMYRNCVYLTKTHSHIVDYIPMMGLHETYSICLKLKTGPILSKVTSVGERGCSRMFQGSINVSIVYTPRIDYNENVFYLWLQDVSTTGTIYIPYDVDWRTAPRNSSGIPAGWEIKYIDPDTMEERESLYPIE